MGTVVSPVITSVQHITTGGVVRRIHAKTILAVLTATNDIRFSDVLREHGQRSVVGRKPTNWQIARRRLRNGRIFLRVIRDYATRIVNGVVRVTGAACRAT